MKWLILFFNLIALLGCESLPDADSACFDIYLREQIDFNNDESWMAFCARLRDDPSVSHRMFINSICSSIDGYKERVGIERDVLSTYLDSIIDLQKGNSIHGRRNAVLLNGLCGIPEVEQLENLYGSETLEIARNLRRSSNRFSFDRDELRFTLNPNGAVTDISTRVLDDDLQFRILLKAAKLAEYRPGN